MPPALASLSTARSRLSDIHKRRLEVFVEIPPSPTHISRLTPKNTPKSALKTMSTDSPRRTAPQMTPNSLKRKLDVYVEIPPSPLHRTTPVNSPRTAGTNALLRRRSQVYVEIPASPLSLARMKGTLNNGMKASPLSTKAFNSNTPIDSPYKKRKLSDTAKYTEQGDEVLDLDCYPNGYFYCHQCRRKCDNSFGLHCTIFSGVRCKSKYCRPCLRNRYGQDTETIRRRGVTRNKQHVPGETYHWTCPKCADNCNCTHCRKSKGLAPTGKLAVLPQIAGISASSQAGTMDVFKVSGSSTTVGLGKETKKAQPDQPKLRAQRAKKPVREPKWTAVPTELNRLQVEDRFFLREFILRFSPLMPKIGVTHLEELDLFHTLSRPCAKALVSGLLDLIAADAEPEEEKLIREALKRISGAHVYPAALWAHLKVLRNNLPSAFFVVPIPDPAATPSFVEDESEDEPNPPPQRTSSRINTRCSAKNAPVEEEVLDLENGVTHAIQLLPPIIALCECALQGASVRAEIEEGSADARGENRMYWSDVRKENERWAKERVLLGWGEGKDKDQTKDKVDEKGAVKKGKAKEKDTEKDKAYRTALAAHKATLTALENTHLLELQGAAPRFGPLGRDSQGRVYYAASVRRGKNKRSKTKMPDEEDRTGLRKWGWFLAVWGRGGMAGSSDGEKEERWWGFADPAEVQQLAKWLAAAEGVDGKESIIEGFGGVPVKGRVDSEKAQNNSGTSVMGAAQGPPSQADVKALVKGLGEYADLLAWRLAGGEASS